MSDTPLAPIYRYFTADLLTNQILAEIPFEGVDYERAIKGAGTFGGKIPVIEATTSLSLYQTTMPGNTALYIVRNGVCVWGGIIWSRQYSVVDRVLTVSASEFTSYFYHRKIWKTWSHQYQARMTVDATGGTVGIDYGSTTALQPGATIQLEWNEQENFRFNGYYTVAPSPTPTTTGFYILAPQITADLISVTNSGTLVTLQTSAPHNFIVGDSITVSGVGAPYDGTHTITSILGVELDQFTYAATGTSQALTSITGSAVKLVPQGTYLDMTLSVRTDTYDYIRSLINAVFADFVGIDFPNADIAPGEQYRVRIANKQITGGQATITTIEPHGLAQGQAVQIADSGPLLDGEYEVTAVLTPMSFRFAQSGALASTPVTAVISTVSAVSAAAQTVTVTTLSAHNFLVGQQVTMSSGYGLNDVGSLFNGDYIITAVPTATSFQYEILDTSVVPTITLSQSTATVGAQAHNTIRSQIVSNVVTLTTNEPHTFAVGNTVVVAGLSPAVTILQKSLDAPNNKATIITDGPHQLNTGDVVVVTGLRDYSNVIGKQIVGTGAAAKTTLTTDTPHNFYVGDTIAVSGMTDTYNLTNMAVAANVATMTTDVAHDIAVGDTVNVNDVQDIYTITNKALTSNVGTLTTSAAHNYQINEPIMVTNIQDVATVVSAETQANLAILTTNVAHNFHVSDQITVTGMVAPFAGTFTVSAVTTTRVFFEVDSTTIRVPTPMTGTITGASSVFNGNFIVSAVTTNTITFALAGNDIDSQIATGTLPPTIAGDSVVNGAWVVASVPTTTTFTFALVANNTSQVIPKIVPPVTGTDDDTTIDTSLPTPINVVQATVTEVGKNNIASVLVTAVTRNTITYAQTTGISNAVAYVLSSGGIITANSIFNGTWTITGTTLTTFTYTLTGQVSNVLETVADNLSFATATGIFNGSYTITAVNLPANQFSYARVHPDMTTTLAPSYGQATVTPNAVVSTFGPYPGNSDIGMGFSTQGYSGTNVTPVDFRGFELTTAGDALDSYSDTIDGFEYRIDCDWNAELGTFTKTFVLIPINYPNPPAPGEVSPLSRFGADNLVFEYPGNIINVELDESAENSSTRFFAIGDSDLGPDAGPPISVASSTDLLNGLNGDSATRKWPLLDADEKVDGVMDEDTLYAYASRYLSESRPPDATLSVDVNGSLPPTVDTYSPGNWCAVVVDDPFVKMRLASDLEPRDTVLVRKIDSIKVTVPDGVTFPETVTLTLVPEWDVDTSAE